MNRWIAAILLFNFKLVHVPGKDHAGPDGLSRRRVVEGDVEEKDDGWVNEVLGLGIWVNSWMERTRTETTKKFQTGQQNATFLVLSLHEDTQASHINIPQTEDDIKMDKLLPLFFKFLATTERPEKLDEKATKKFLKQAMRFFCNG
ncbi:hypothetical protein M422DRAFT_196680 [Sphaerobolus stellatus SS14]|uniref:Uncharacterized protein n=1 Tax=Sphaerobolus stellatus (strain SS14) TaxID=990650 RepID=A0A0C9UB95_SPHS4|nr:hypothetical protein M422DRAFT_196680 [Sphaerobolus stellatus SS14]